jgi:hypothetical protein
MTMHPARAACTLAASLILALAAPLVAATPAPSFDAAVVATGRLLEAGQVTGHVTAAKTTGCSTVLTLDSAQAYTLHLANRGVAMNKMLMIGDGDDAVALTFQGDGAAAAASNAEQALAPISDRCQG